MNVSLIIKSASRNSTPPIPFFFFLSRSSLGRSDTCCGIARFNLRELCAAQTGRPEVEEDLNMDKVNNNKNNDEDQKNTKDDITVKARDAMVHSFGEGYATRSDEEGFGGVYVRYYDSHKLRKPGEMDENHPEYDKSQGSEVKEKEKARFQKSASS